MRSPLVAILVSAAIAGCAGGGQATPDDASSRVTIVVGNEFAGTVTAYAVWPGGRRTRLGEVRQERTRTFETVRAGDEISLGVVLETAPPVGTTAGPTGFQGGAPPRINPEMVMSEGIMIASGEGIEWRILSTGSLVYRRLVPQ
jgi:ABC-type glycerol-3-phosphate transport system substrate-binding protein